MQVKAQYLVFHHWKYIESFPVSSKQKTTHLLKSMPVCLRLCLCVCLQANYNSVTLLLTSPEAAESPLV